MEKKEREKKRYHERLSKGLCVRCGEKLDRDGSTCIKCLEKNNKAARESRKKKLEQGLCAVCSKPLDKDGVYCSECSEKNSKYLSDRSKKRKEQGLCVNCGKPLDSDGSQCNDCKNKKAQYNSETRHFLQSIGMCPRCGKEKIYGDEKMCQFCKIKMTEYNRIYRASRRKHTNQVSNDYARKRYAENSEKGICTRCGKRKADHGFKQCGLCRAKQSRQRKRKKEKDGIVNKRDEWIEKGLCFFCGNPVKEGYKVCEKHYQINVENATSEKANKARKELKKQGILY